ncbi:MAG: tRNA 2-thiouridine(34) synthase MnmA [Holosporales bacterium]|nr:tRNA 2-thiouridine(34) synthase MnmA [Holosporales bacterium]
MEKAKKTYAVAMSGGVDSSTTAAILLEKGNNVFGVTMDINEYSSSTVANAKNICNILGIKHFVLDAKNIFKKHVMDVFADYYANGLTPNPCALCNRDIKMNALLNFAKEKGADVMATGHYVNMSVDGDLVILKEADNQNKDQSYFLALVDKRNLKDVIFPLGKIKDKEETRKIAQSFGLPNFNQKDSQDICFIPNGDYKSFLRSAYKDLNLFAKGNIKLASSGEIMGLHEGLANYTIGQRKGLHISYKYPLYVKKLDTANNEIIVCLAEELDTMTFTVVCVNWIIDMPASFEALIKHRSICKKSKAAVTKTSDNSISVQLYERPSSPITSGQICVMYNQDKAVIGGGIIKS